LPGFPQQFLPALRVLRQVGYPSALQPSSMGSPQRNCFGPLLTRSAQISAIINAIEQDHTRPESGGSFDGFTEVHPGLGHPACVKVELH
jgi:hypothetical protein